MQTSNDIILILLTIFGCTGFWSFIQWWFSTKHRKATATEEALLAILHEMIYPMTVEIITRKDKVVGIEEMDRLRHLYEPYRRLGGNGPVKARYELIETFKRVEDAEL